MFRFLRPVLFQSLRPPYPVLRARLARPGPFIARTTLATITLSFGALALQTPSNDPTQPGPQPDHPPLIHLLRAYFVFSLCSIPSLVDASPRILSFLSTIPVLREVSEAFLKVTFFDQFVGAETVDGCIPLLHSLRRSNQGVLFSYSVEQSHESSPNPKEPNPDRSRRALESILHSIDIAADFEDSLSNSASPATGTWVAVKLSTLLPDPGALWVLSDWIVRRHIDPDVVQSHPDNVPSAQILFPGAPDAQDLQLFLHSNDGHVDEHIQTLRTLHTNLRKICTRAHARGIKLTIDAEETWFQPAIDLFSVLLMQEFNPLCGRGSGTGTETINRAAQPLVYMTLQAYLVRTPSFLDLLIKHAKDNEYSLGVKLVRGAYVDAEVDAHRDRVVVSPGTKCGSISPDENPPTYPNKELTDEAYDDCVRVLVREVARDVVGDEEGRSRSETPGIGVLFGTHNWKSSRLVLDEILRVGLGEGVVVDDDLKDDEFSDGRVETRIEEGRRSEAEKKIVLSEKVRQRVCMAQLYGMSDALAAYLVDRTSTSELDQTTKWKQSTSPFVIRYVPFGPLRDVMPYLARRATENRSVLGPSPSSSSPVVSRSVSDDRVLNLKGGGGDETGNEQPEGGGAVQERKRVGRLIWARIVGFWRF